jgi:hypothetical protein
MFRHVKRVDILNHLFLYPPVTRVKDHHFNLITESRISLQKYQEQLEKAVGLEREHLEESKSY